MPDLHPALPLLCGALLVPLARGRFRNWFVIALPALAFYLVASLEPGSTWQVNFFDYDLTLLRVDKLSRIFAIIFTLNAFAAFIYAFHVKDSVQHVSALVYIGSALGAIFAGDLISFYLFWETMAVASTFLILARKTERALGAGLRYILVHLAGGLCLLAGILIHINQTGSIAFTTLSAQSSAAWLMLLGVLVNAAAPPFSAWLSDAYPEATISGGVILSAYTTKTAVYTLIRGFPGWEILIAVGCVMSIYGIIYALLENDIRRILAYAIINQVGFMLIGVGIGTAVSLNGATAQASASIIYTSLLWMAAGAVLHMTGKNRCTDLGGLARSMPWTLAFGAIGALAISSFPGTSGFTTKTLIIESSLQQHLFWPWLSLKIASAGVFLYAGAKLPYFVFFSKEQGLRPGETQPSMLIAMGFLAFICLFLGFHPSPLYRLLPYEMPPYQAYTPAHIISQLQLLMFSALGFFLFLPLLKMTPAITLDTDWFYRKGGRLFYALIDRLGNGLNELAEKLLVKGLVAGLCRFARQGPAHLAAFALAPYWRLRYQPDQTEKEKARLYRSFSTGTAGLGIMAAGITLYLLVFFF